MLSLFFNILSNVEQFFLRHPVLKVSYLVSYFLNAELSMWLLTLRQICFVTLKTSCCVFCYVENTNG